MHVGDNADNRDPGSRGSSGSELQMPADRILVGEEALRKVSLIISDVGGEW